MKITREYLQEKRACIEGLSWFHGNYPNGCTHVALCRKLVKTDNHNWALWLLEKSLSTDNLLKYAIHCAEMVLHIYEEKYPDNSAPRKAIEAAKKYSENKTEENRLAADAAAYAAANAAYAAANAAYAAAYAAYAAADAADAADAAAYAAYAAAYAAANAAANAAMKEKIIEFGSALLSEQKEK